MTDITFTKVYDNEGSFLGLELKQDNDRIVISLATSRLDSAKHSYKWDSLKPIIDKFQRQTQEEASGQIYSDKTVAKDESVSSEAEQPVKPLFKVENTKVGEKTITRVVEDKTEEGA